MLLSFSVFRYPLSVFMKRAPLLFLNVFVIATCGLIYELLAGTLSSYVLGDSVTQFSLIIGIYLFAMGVGSWLSRFIEKHVAEKFVDIELAVAVIGGFSPRAAPSIPRAVPARSRSRARTGCRT